MQGRKHAQVTALVVGVGVVALALLRVAGIVSFALTGISEGGSWWGRLAHPFMHVGLLHALLNVYVFWQLVFFFPFRLRHLLLAFLVAVTCPASIALWSPPLWHSVPVSQVVGLSGVDYVLLGWVVPGVARRVRFCLTIMAWLAFGALLGTVAVGFHGYCFLAGMIIGCSSR
ncbi:MAG: hypothetical protein J5548_09800 [Prevotella sp.]|nr:hypothetical protein [Prevotella sp.]